MLVEQQIAERWEWAGAAIAKTLEPPNGKPYGDYRVKSASGQTYRVAMRGPSTELRRGLRLICYAWHRKESRRTE
jgi:hypothetical protein